MEKIKIPKDMDDAKALGTVLSKYKDTYYTEVLVAYFATYVLYPWIKRKKNKKTLFSFNLSISLFPILANSNHSLLMFLLDFACFMAAFDWISIGTLWHITLFRKSFFCAWCICKVVHLNPPLSLQTFAIPGSIFLSILSGYLYPFHLALFLVCLVSNQKVTKRNWNCHYLTVAT